MGDLDLTPDPGQPKGSETILSEEMWEKVLMNLTDPSDVLNAGKTCVQFQRILQSKTIEAYLAKTLPFLMKYMDGKSVLNCRSVSKGWRGVVDNLFENYFLGRTVLEKPKELEPFRFATYQSAFYSFGTGYLKSSDYERFMREMKDHPRNPFIGRAVYFELPGSERREEDRQDFQTVYNFFEMFGKHIWTLRLYLSEGFRNQIEGEHLFPFIIRDLFELVPNLKKLYIKGVLSLPGSMSRREIRALSLSPPALVKLDISETYCGYQREDQAYDEVEKAILLRHSNSQLTVLHTKTLDQLWNLNNWPNLKELHFTSIKRITDLDVILRNLRLPKLELLSISLATMGIPDYKQWRRRGQKKAFKKFFLGLYHLCISSPNLKTLRLETIWLWDKEPRQRFGFPRGLPCPENIKTLEIEDTYCRDENCHSDYSFLLRFPHVENIRVFNIYRNSGWSRSWETLKNIGMYRQYHDDFDFDHDGPIKKQREIVEVHKFMYEGRMYESNIWKLLPKLKVFSCGEDVYTRSSYEQRQAHPCCLACGSKLRKQK